jgi:hypothetical protein
MITNNDKFTIINSKISNFTKEQQVNILKQQTFNDMINLYNIYIKQPFIMKQPIGILQKGIKVPSKGGASKTRRTNGERSLSSILKGLSLQDKKKKKQNKRKTLKKDRK